VIPKREILELATSSGIRPHVIEKDYVLGWILAGIHQHEIGKTWAFKGGTCLKKCYFETYRFSEDLDFTLSDPAQIDRDYLNAVFSEISEWIYENAGIDVPVDKLTFDIYENPRGVTSCQGRVFYRGPISPDSHKRLPRIKLDLTVDELLVEPSVTRAVQHDYSDFPDEGICIQSYSYEEVFAEKTRALSERTRPRDLYDVINFFRRPESGLLAKSVRRILGAKCQFKSIPMPNYADLLGHRDQCEAGWGQQLSHQMQSLPPFDSFWNELPNFFEWLYAPVNLTQQSLAPMPPQLGARVSTGPVDFRSYATSRLPVSLMERIRFAAANHLCVELEYRKENGEQNIYLIEPYSLNETSAGNLLLHALKHQTHEIRAFRADRMISVRTTDIPFTPSYRVDLIPQGPHNVMSAMPQSGLQVPVRQKKLGTTRPARKQLAKSTWPSSGPTYVYQCPMCQKKFTRKKMNGKLNPHKTKQGFSCSGRTGMYVETKY
jgi:predicted nucleotidyltransferase component of viral defense system